MEDTKSLTRKDLSPIPVQALGKIGWEIQELERYLEDCDPGSIEEDQWANKLATLEYEKAVYVPALAAQIKNRETFVDAAKQALKDRLDYLSRLSKTTDRMKRVLKQVVGHGEKYDNQWVSVRTRKTSRIEIDPIMEPIDLEKNRPELIRTKVLKEFDKTAMMNAAKRGDNLPDGISLVEDYSISIK